MVKCTVPPVKLPPLALCARRYRRKSSRAGDTGITVALRNSERTAVFSGFTGNAAVIRDGPGHHKRGARGDGKNYRAVWDLYDTVDKGTPTSVPHLSAQTAFLRHEYRNSGLLMRCRHRHSNKSTNPSRYGHRYGIHRQQKPASLV